MPGRPHAQREAKRHEDQRLPEQGAPLNDSYSEAIEVSLLFTSAIEQAMSSSKLSSGQSSGERNRARHEAVAQYLLDDILRREGELDRFLAEYDVHIDHEPLLFCEWPTGDGESRFDHVIDDEGELGAWRSVVVIEDKLDSPLATDQLDRYCRYLADFDGQSTLMVLHPRRNPLNADRARIDSLSREFPSVSIRFVSWSDLCDRMIRSAPPGTHAALWAALKEFTESVGTGLLGNLPDAEVLAAASVAEEVRNVFLTAQVVAARLGTPRSHQLAFSLHGGNPAPWLQMGMTDIKRSSLGLDLDVEQDPGALYVGVRGPDDLGGRRTHSKIGVFRDGRLTPAAERRVAELVELGEQIWTGEATLPTVLPGRAAGKPVSEQAKQALELVGAVFQAQAIKNPHRGGAPSRKTRGINEGDGHERLGAVLVREVEGRQRVIHLFIGPPSGRAWESCAIWIRTDDGEQEITVEPGESGRDYVLRVWREARRALGG